MSESNEPMKSIIDGLSTGDSDLAAVVDFAEFLARLTMSLMKSGVGPGRIDVVTGMAMEALHNSVVGVHVPDHEFNDKAAIFIRANIRLAEMGMEEINDPELKEIIGLVRKRMLRSEEEFKNGH